MSDEDIINYFLTERKLHWLEPVEFKGLETPYPDIPKGTDDNFCFFS